MASRRAKQAGHEICALLTMFSPENGTSRSHGLPRQLLTDQANALGLALHVGYAGWSDYEQEFKRCLSALVSDGIELAVFGDIFLDDHRHWVERVCSEAGCDALEPLWGEATDRLLEETIAAGIRAHVCTVRPECVALAHRHRPFPLAYPLLANRAFQGYRCTESPSHQPRPGTT